MFFWVSSQIKNTLNFGSIEQEQIQKSKAIMVWGYSLISPSERQYTLDAVQCAQSSEVKVFFDPGPALVHCTKESVGEVLLAASGIFGTEEELEMLNLPDFGSEIIPNCDLIVTKKGKDGCVIQTPDNQMEIAPFKVEQRDSTGAGDVFDAAFLCAMLSGQDLTQCARLANAAGAVMCAKLGSGTNAPTKEEVFALCK